MKRKLTFLTFLIFSLLSLHAQTARVQIIHNSPDPTVDVYAGTSLLLNDFAFRTASAFVDVPSGLPIPIGVAPASSTSVADAIFTQTVTFESGKTYVVAASGVVFNPTTPFTLIANPDGRETATAPNKVNVAILHGSPDAPAVDIAVRGIGNVATNVAYGSYTPYLTLDPKKYYIDVKGAGSNTIVQTYEADLSGLAGQAAYVFASGYFTPGVGVPFGLFAALSDGTVISLPTASVASVQIIHNSTSGTVDIWANSDKLLDNFTYRSATPFIFVPAGVDINIGVAADTSTSAASSIATFPVNLVNGGSYIVTANGIVGDAATPFTLNVNFTARQFGSNPNQVDVSVLHGATNAPAVDVDEFLAGNLIGNLAYNNYTPYLSLDPNAYNLVVRAAGPNSTVGIYSANLAGLQGKSAYVFASGLLNSTTTPFALMVALADGTVIELPKSATTRAQIIHDSPTPTVDVYAGSQLLLNDFAFRTATPFVDVLADVNMPIGVAPANSSGPSDAIFTANATFESGKTYVVTASGVVFDPIRPFGLVVNPNGRETAANPNKVDVTIQHNSIDAPGVDIHVRGIGTVAANLAYQQYTGYLSLDPKAYFIDVLVAGTNNIVKTYKADLSGLSGRAAYVFASGFVSATGLVPFGVYVALNDGTVVALPEASLANVQIIHNSPNPTVDVWANGELLVDNFAYRTATPFVSVEAGVDINIGIAPDTSTSAASAIANFTVNLETNRNYIVTAMGIVGDPTTPFTLNVNPDARQTASSAGNVDVAILHGSPNAPAVDVDEVFVGNILENLAYGQFTPYISLVPNVYDFAIRPTGVASVVQTYRADLSGLVGASAYVFASGLLGNTDTPFALMAALANGTVIELPVTPTARVQVIHNSPSPTVDVYTGNVRLLDDFAFRTATPFVNLPSGRTIDLGVAPSTSASVAEAIATFPVSLEEGKAYTVFAAGIVGSTTTPFSLYAFDNALETAAPGFVATSVFHGSPDAPAVDVAERLAGQLVADLAFGENTPYLFLPTGDYVIDVRAAGSPDIVKSYSATLSALDGQAIRVFASGNLGGNPNFGLFAALADGSVIELPEVRLARLQIIHNSPSPTVDIYVEDQLAVDDFEYQTATPYFYFPAGETLSVGVAPGTSQGPSDVIASFDLTLENGKTYVAIASGIVGDVNTPFTILLNNDGQEATTDPNQLEFKIHHGIPNAPPVAILDATDGTVLLPNLTFGESTPYLAFQPDVLIADLATAIDNTDVVGTFGADLSEGQGITGVVFASGLLGGDYTLLVALPDGTVGEFAKLTRAQVIHNAPSPTVDVYFDGDLVLDNFAFRQATGIGFFPADTPFELAVAPANSNSVTDAIYELPVSSLKTGKFYTIIAAGEVGGSPAFGLFVQENPRYRSLNPQSVTARFFHGSPNAPAVDVISPLGILFDDVAFGGYSANLLLVPAASYVVDITPANDNSTIVQSHLADLTGLNGEFVTIFASGYLNPSAGQPPLSAWAALTNGTVVELPIVVGTKDADPSIGQVMLAPNPATAVLNVQMELNQATEVRYRVFDATSRMVSEGQWPNMEAGKQLQTLQVGTLEAGMYQLEILTATGQQTMRFVKM